MRISAVALVFALTACSGGGSGTDTTADSPGPTQATEQSAAPQTQPAADEPSSEGAAGVVATIGDMTWEFDEARCFIIEGTPGEEGSVWKITNSGSFQVVLEAGDNVNGIAVGGGPFSEDPDNDWDTSEPTFEVDGSTVVGSGTFTNRVNNETAEGTVTAICPDWG